MAAEGFRLGIDFGTSHTVAVLRGSDGRVRPLLFDASPLLPSAVFAGRELLTGADAERAGLVAPAGLEPNPKRRIDDGTVWLGGREVPVVDLVAAVLRRVVEEARRVAGGPLSEVVLTHPAGWQRTRLGLLADAAERAGLGAVGFVPEPVAAAAYFAQVLGEEIPPGQCLVVYDFGAGTFDVSVVRPRGQDHEVVASAGLPELGGLDLDALVVAHARTLTGDAADPWARLDRPQTLAEQHAHHLLWRGARAAKEQLSRHSTADVHVPLAESAVHLTREEFETAARPPLERTTSLTRRVLAEAGLPPEEIGGVFLVGGSSRIPLVATLLHRAVRTPPTALDHPELVVAEGCLYATATRPMLAAAAVPPAEATVAPDGDAATAAQPVSVSPAPRPYSLETPDLPARHPATALRRIPRPAWLTTAAILVLVVAFWIVNPSDDGGVTGAKLLATLDGDGAVRSVEFNSDGTEVLTGGDTRMPERWNLERRTVIDTFPLQYSLPVSEVAYSRDGTTMAFVGGPLHYWSVAMQLRTGGDDRHEQTVGVTAVAFSPIDDLIATGDNHGDVLFWDTARNLMDGDRMQVYEDGDVTDVAFSPDGQFLATAGSDGGIHLWDVLNRETVGAALLGHEGVVLGMAFSPDGKTLVSGGADGTVRLWEVGDREPIGDPLTGHDGQVFEVAFNPDGQTVASAGADGTARLWDVVEQEQIGNALTGHRSEVYDVAFSLDGGRLATASEDTTTRIWELEH
ncbi:Hsp70 family protein [Cryptosporangium minutisporangium]|uniref:Hsp70 family protein n=1 Tax=Cryptosporangium minutisporangium TaxID=113569 RepID=A0ABP6SSK7_9ACTN